MRRVSRLGRAGLATLGVLAAGLAIAAAPALAVAPETPETISPAKDITATSATFEGILNPHKAGEPGTFQIYYLVGSGSGCYGDCIEVDPPEPTTGNVGERVKQQATGLQPNQEYTFLIHVQNNVGEGAFGQPVSFTTLRAAPEVEKIVTSADSTEATLQAQVDANNETTTYSFEYSTKETAGALDAPITTLTGGGPLEGAGNQVSVATGALPPGTNYFYRVVATNPTGTTSSAVKEFATVPVPRSEAVESIGGSTATFKGSLTPLNEHVATQYHFDYKLGSECTGESSTPSEEAGTGAGTEVAETVAASGLQPDREYTVCFVTSNAFGGEVIGSPEPFSTLELPPEVDRESVTGLTAFTATVETVVNPNNQFTFPCEVEYEAEEPLLATPTGAFCYSAPEIPGWLPGEYGERTASAQLEGLEADTTYYYRVLAPVFFGTGKGEGPIQSFKTAGPPQPTTGQAQDITRVTAALSGSVDPERVAGGYHFVYVDQAGYEKALAEGAENPYAEGASTAAHELPDGNVAEAVGPVVATGLLPETTYVYALVASNEAGAKTGGPETFTTGAATPPIVTTGGASEITMSTATIAGTLDTQGLDVSYAFEVSTEPANPGPPSGGGSIGAGPTEASVSVALQGLQPGTTYYYRILATSTDGTSYGATHTFTTPGFTPPLTQPATLPLLGTPTIAFPTGSEANTGKAKTKSLTKAQKLKAALKACRKDHNKSKRQKCEKAAKKAYGPAKKHGSSKKKG